MLIKIITASAFLILLTPHLVSPQPSPYSFNLQYIGHTRYVTPAEEATRDFCNSFWCTNDAHLLFTRSSQHNNSDPCTDFRNFSVGTALDVNAVNERYVYRGFISELEFKFWEQQRRLLAAKIDKNDHRVVKVAKNVFQKCIKSRHALRHLHGHQELIKRLTKLGGSPYLSNHVAWNPKLFSFEDDFGLLEKKNSAALDDASLWNARNFSAVKILEKESADGLWLLLGYELTRCVREKREAFCLRRQSPLKWNEVAAENLLEVLEYMNDSFIAGRSGKNELKEKMFKPSMERFREFTRSLRVIEEKFVKVKDEKISIGDLEVRTGLKWTQILNEQLSERMKINESIEIFVENVEMLSEAVKNLESTDKRVVADYFSLSYIFLYQFIFVFHFDENFATNTIGTKKSPQRWESCLVFTIVSFLQPAMLFMYNEIKRDENLVRKVKSFAQEAVNESRVRFVEGNRLPLAVSAEVVNKLKSLKILVSLEDFGESNLTKFYKDLKLSGDEEFLETFLEIKNFNLKVRNEDDASQKKKLEKFLQLQRITFDAENGNVLYIPSMWTLYPWFHPERPRFFNMATMFTQLLVRIHKGIKTFVYERFKISTRDITTGLENAVQISYNHYHDWLKSHSELQIGANFLTNPQLFWMARAIFHFTKYHNTVKREMNAMQRLQIEYMHVEFKSKAGFQEAFACKMSKEEKKTYAEYAEKYFELVDNEK